MVDETERLERVVQALHQPSSQWKFDPQNPQVRLHEPSFGRSEILAACEVMQSTQVTMGQQVRELESRFAAQLGSSHGLMVNSGSSANLLAIAAVTNPAYSDHLKPGDEVIVPALCWSTTLWPIIQCGLTPVIVDINPGTLNIDAETIESAITPRTRAIMPVHVYGNPCAMDSMTAIAKERSLIIIEDACEAMGATFQGQPVGTFGAIGTFSTYFSHHITTLEGGFCLTSDQLTDELLRVLRSHGWIRDIERKEMFASEHPNIDPRFLFINLGYNLRPTELQGAMGHEQLDKLEGFLARRRAVAESYMQQLEPYFDHVRLQTTQKDGGHAWFGMPIIIRDNQHFTTAQLTKFLNRRGIETRPLIAGNIARQPALKYYPHKVRGELVGADKAMTDGFAIGNHHAMDDQAVAYVAGVFKEFFR